VIVTQGLQPEGEEGHLFKSPCNKYGAGVAKRGLPILCKDNSYRPFPTNYCFKLEEDGN
jgi:hypothetical protein